MIVPAITEDARFNIGINYKLPPSHSFKGVFLQGRTLQGGVLTIETLNQLVIDCKL